MRRAPKLSVSVTPGKQHHIMTETTGGYDYLWINMREKRDCRGRVLLQGAEPLGFVHG